MIDLGKHNMIGVMVNAIDYETAVSKIIGAAKARAPFGVTALAVHGVMTGYTDPEQRTRINSLDLVVPDGQPVRWALNWLHKTALRDRVRGMELTVRILAEAERNELPVYFYGSTPDVLAGLQTRLRDQYPRLTVAGAEPSKFRKITPEEKQEVVARIRQSRARITFVGLGCPRQEVWAYEYRHDLSMPILAVGAAFDFLAGNLPEAPQWMRDTGLEWLFRLKSEPRRLWRRYLILNPWYVGLVLRQRLGLLTIPEGAAVRQEISYG